MDARLRGHDGISVIPAKAGSMSAGRSCPRAVYYAADAPWGAGSTVTIKPSSSCAFSSGCCSPPPGSPSFLDNRGFAEVIASYQLGLPGLLLLPLGRCSG